MTQMHADERRWEKEKGLATENTENTEKKQDRRCLPLLFLRVLSVLCG